MGPSILKVSCEAVDKYDTLKPKLSKLEGQQGVRILLYGRILWLGKCLNSVSTSD